MKKTDASAKRIFEFCVSTTREEMGRAAARDVAQAMSRFIREMGKVNIVLAAAPSQNEFLTHLGRAKGIDWSRVTAFHLDDYVDLPRHHPNTFEEYLAEHIFNRVEPGKKYLFKALKGSPAEIAKKYAAAIRSSGGIDISCLGIGENGHLAFCEPGSDFHDPRIVRIVRIDERTVKQQYRDYQNNPRHAAQTFRSSTRRKTLGVAAAACIRDRRQCLSKMLRANEMASSGIDAGCHPRGFGAGGFGGPSAAQAKEGAPRAAFASVSEDASCVNERCLLRDVALALAGADARMYPQVKKNHRA